MRILTTACLLVMFICVGCGSGRYWYNEDKSYNRARSDCLECLYMAQGEMLTDKIQEEKESVSSPDVHEKDKDALFEDCMKDKGYEKVDDYKLDYHIRKGDVDYNGVIYPVAGN